MYDTSSFRERKNPEGAILAFRKAFAPDDTSVGLVIKVNNSALRPKDIQVLGDLSSGYGNIHIIDAVLPRNQVNGLIACTDCFISLHRSEGFGLGLAEAMYLGKPVIGTNWSGNTDFMNNTNSCPVNYRLVQVGENYGPYEAYQTWAEPDLDHAADYMMDLVAVPDWRDTIARAGQNTIRSQFSPTIVGEMIKNRLTRLGFLQKEAID
nr:glycosyltransferase [Paenibacillus prosopidis]